MSERFTVFWPYGFQENSGAPCNGDFSGAPLAKMIALSVNEFCSCPIAWAPEWPDGYGGEKPWEVLRDESIAAGRIIELVDGKYIPRGVEESWETRLLAECLTDEQVDAMLDPNAAMITRDGPAKPKPAAVIPEPKSTTKAALAGLGLRFDTTTGHQINPAHQLKGL